MKTTSSNRDILIQSLFENVNALKRGMTGYLQAVQRDWPVSGSQLELLFTISHNQPVSFKQLAQQLYMTPGAISQLAESLEQRELINRQVDAKDRRVQCLHVSKKGSKLLQDIEKRRQKLMEAIAQDLSDEELALWLHVQEKMIQQLQADLNGQI